MEAEQWAKKWNLKRETAEKGGFRMYQKHKMELIKFEDNNVFAGTEWASDGEEGEDQYSLRPDRSDK